MTWLAWPMPSTGAAELIVARVRKTPGHPGSVHSHDHEEVVVALAGVATAMINRKEVELAAGDVLIISAG